MVKIWFYNKKDDCKKWFYNKKYKKNLQQKNCDFDFLLFCKMCYFHDKKNQDLILKISNLLKFEKHSLFQIKLVKFAFSLKMLLFYNKSFIFFIQILSQNLKLCKTAAILWKKKFFMIFCVVIKLQWYYKYVLYVLSSGLKKKKSGSEIFKKGSKNWKQNHICEG